MRIEHFMMFGTFAEQRHFVYPDENTYDGVIFNANMVAHAPAGLAAFLITRTNKLSYIIDPLTHAFQHAVNIVLKDDESGLKKAFEVLATAYGEPLKGNAGVKSLTPSNFHNEEVRRNFVSGVLQFQRKVILDRASGHPDCKYFTEEELKSSFAPRALVSPYFYISENTRNEWLDLNLTLLSDALKVRQNGEAVYAEIVIEKGLLSDEAWISDMVDKYLELNPDGYLIWIDEFDEHLASRHELKNLWSFCNSLSAAHKPIINLHGGYFSVLMAGTLGKNSLTGVTHGPEFGECRAVVPVGGGLPFAKYYMPLIHERVKYRDMVGILQSKKWNLSAELFHEKVCNCNVCVGVVNGKIDNFAKFGESSPIERKKRAGGIVRIDYPTQEARLLCLKHYLERKKLEFEGAMREREMLLDELRNGVAELRDAVGYEGIKHLLNWIAVFEEIALEPE